VREYHNSKNVRYSILIQWGNDNIEIETILEDNIRENKPEDKSMKRRK